MQKNNSRVYTYIDILDNDNQSLDLDPGLQAWLKPGIKCMYDTFAGDYILCDLKRSLVKSWDTIA